MQFSFHLFYTDSVFSLNAFIIENQALIEKQSLVYIVSDSLFSLFAFLREYLKSALLLKMACWHFARMAWSQKIFLHLNKALYYI